MTEKERYEICFLTGLNGPCSIQDTEAEICTFYNDLGYVQNIKPVCDRMNEQDKIIKELKKENTILKLENRLLKDANEDVELQLDYIQSSITEAIKNSKTTLEQKALKKIIEKYNGYILRSKQEE